MDELRLAQLLHKDITEDKKLEILKDLDVTCTISDKPSAFQEKTALLGYNCLHIAVMKSDSDLTQTLLNLGANVLQKCVQDGKTPLRKAVDYVENYLGTPVWELMGVLQERPLVATLLSAQIKSNNPLNAKCEMGISHLHIACMFNHAETVQYFARFNEPVDQAINVDSRKLPGYTPLHCAIKYSSSETAIILLTLGADIYLENAQGINSVCYLIERLLDANDYRTMSNSSYCYPYEKEIERLDSILKVIALRNRTDDSKLVEYTGLSAFHLACMLKDNWIMQSYITWDFKDINKPVTCKSKLWSGWTPLHFAVCCNIQTCKILLQNRANIGIKNAKGETAFDLCLQRYSPEVSFSYLSEDTVLSDKSTKLSDLMLAISNHNTCQQLLLKLVDINLSVPLESTIWPGYNLLHISIAMKYKRKFLEIFRKETDYDLKTGYAVDLPKNRTSRSNSLYWPELEAFLKRGCSVYAKNADGLTPIHLAFKLNECYVLEELLIHARKNVVGPGNLSVLHIACLMNKKDVVEHLLEQGADVNSPITSSFEYYEEPRSVSKMNIQSNLRKVLVRKNSTPLHIAVIFKMEEVVEKLLKKHCDVHAKDEHGLTPLHLSLASTKRIAQLLLTVASDLRDVKREDGLSYLHVATFADDEKAVKKLLQAGADVNGFIKDTVPDCFANFAGKTPLHLAVGGKITAFILVKKGANIFAEDPTCNYETPLDLAMREVNSSVSKFLFEKLKSNETKTDALTASGLTTLHIACATFDLDWTRDLLKRGANPNARMKDGQGRANTPMHLVIAKATSTHNISKNLELFLTLLLLRGADVTISNNYLTPVHLIANAYFKEFWFYPPSDKAILSTIADLLLSNQRSYVLNPTDANGFSHFHFACVTNNLVVIKNYLDNGIDVNHSKCPFADKYGGYTPLHFAIEHKNLDVIQLLLERGADVRAEDSNGNTPFHVAIKTGFINLQLFDVVLNKGADINAKNVKNETPIVCLLHHGNVNYKQLHFFLKRGSVIDIRETICDGQGVIGFTMGNTEPSDIELVFETFEKFANVKDAINKGFVAIHSVVSVRQSQNLTREHYLNAIQRLTEKGSDIDEQDENGKRALDVAISFNNFGAIEALLLLGANVSGIEDDIEDDYFPENRSASSDNEKFMRNHLWKMGLVKLDLNVFTQETMKNEGWEPDDNTVHLYQSELEKIKHTRICQSLTAKHFLSEWGAVIEYPTMSVADCQAVDNFFKQGDELRKEFPEFAGLLTMQYRKALARVKLMQPVKDILVTAGIDLPDLCLEAILKYFKNSELSFLVKEADEVFHLRKRRKIE